MHSAQEDPATPHAPGGAALDGPWIRQAGPHAIFHARADAALWSATAARVQERGGRLVALWGSDRRSLDGQHAVAAAYALAGGLYWLDLPLAAAGDAHDAPSYPDLGARFPCAVRMQRAVADLNGLLARAAGASAEAPPVDARPWLRHAAWPPDYYPLRREASGRERFDAGDERYAFVAVEGEGVHEIAVGPVHAGIIEPGHFRFSVVGEKVLRLEERLGYTHKGVEKRFAGMTPAQGARLAARVSGDSTVGYGWAYCAAVEALCAAEPPARAQWLRALALERERVANHLGDLGALGNDAGFAFGLAQFSRLREDWLRRNHACFGHRLLMDWIIPGGVRSDLPAQDLHALADEAGALAGEVCRLGAIYDGHAGLQDRFAGAGCVSAALARRLGLTGLAARASGTGSDLRSLPEAQPYAALEFRAAAAGSGDVAARVAVRFAEIAESLRLIQGIARALPDGPVACDLGAPAPRGRGTGWVEAWRGELLVALELDDCGLLLRAHCHDPSWQNWPALEHAVIGNIVPDFPLINKSFNLSYSGQDL
jgi:Ni,Fe-hydrogenase III large subunit/Ni,Fe-hydrogenase III component G